MSTVSPVSHSLWIQDVHLTTLERQARKSSPNHGFSVDDIRVRFGNRLRQVRKELSVSQEKLALLADLHRTYVSSVERGQRNVTIETIEKFALALKVPMGMLMPDAQSTASAR